jgi:hypothetical protein
MTFLCDFLEAPSICMFTVPDIDQPRFTHPEAIGCRDSCLFCGHCTWNQAHLTVTAKTTKKAKSNFTG